MNLLQIDESVAGCRLNVYKLRLNATTRRSSDTEESRRGAWSREHNAAAPGLRASLRYAGRDVRCARPVFGEYQNLLSREELLRFDLLSMPADSYPSSPKEKELSDKQ